MLPCILPVCVVLVLIETLWNVNMPIPTDRCRVPSINRNIVECKYNTTYIIPLRQTVLIETLWNVNMPIPTDGCLGSRY